MTNSLLEYLRINQNQLLFIDKKTIDLLSKNNTSTKIIKKSNEEKVIFLTQKTFDNHNTLSGESFEDAMDAGNLYAVHFSGSSDSGANAGLGVYQNVAAKGVGMHNFGHRTYNTNSQKECYAC